MDPYARILDANANRASEALRVMEDIARFALDNAELTSELKHIRHGLRGTLERLPIDLGALLASRAADRDVGTAIHTEAEAQRDGLRGVAAAAGPRLAEALRSMAEVAKALGPGLAGSSSAAHDLEQLRYRAYTAHQRLVLALGGDRRQWRLCILITESLCTHLAWPRVAEAALSAGADCLQLREKSLEGGEFLRRAQTLRAMTRSAGASLIINDRPDIALLANADGVHLGQTDLPITAARALAGFRLLIGVSTSRIDQARRAVADGADYCGVGPMFATTTKHKPELSGPSYLAEYLGDPATSRIPHLAIGGITTSNIRDLTAVGCRGIAVSSAVCSADDPARACRELLAALPTAEPAQPLTTHRAAGDPDSRARPV